MEQEIWKDIEGYKGLYQVSNLGRVKSLERKVHHTKNGTITIRERIIKQTMHRDGYLKVILHKNGYMKTYLVHRLVAQSFLQNTKKLSQVNHINEVKTDNTVCNLQWCDAKYNVNFGTGMMRRAKTMTNRSDLSREVFCVELKITYKSLKDAERETGNDHSSIAKCCLGKQKTCGGYHWQYVEKKKEVV